MNTQLFDAYFSQLFPPDRIAEPTPMFNDPFVRSYFDPAFVVPGMSSVKVQKLLNLAHHFVEEGECYVEVGCFVGKTLISAMANNPRRMTYACDNFSEFSDTPEKTRDALFRHLEMFGLARAVTFFECDFRDIMNREKIPEPIGVYFYDGGHAEQDQYDAIVLAEPLLADEALVIVDDWNMPAVPQGTMRAIEASENQWDTMHVLPAGEDPQGDPTMWWDGLGVFRFRRRV